MTPKLAPFLGGSHPLSPGSGGFNILSVTAEGFDLPKKDLECMDVSREQVSLVLVLQSTFLYEATALVKPGRLAWLPYHVPKRQTAWAPLGSGSSCYKLLPGYWWAGG